MDLSLKIKKAYEIKCNNFGNKIEFAYPNETLALSTTNNECNLNCAHCNGYYLKNMTPINLYKEKIKSRNISSFLLSGGCSFSGDIPINNHLDTIKQLRQEGYKLNAHIGLMDEENIEKVCKYLDLVSFDLVFDEETIKEVYKINKTKDDYINTYENIKKYSEVSPHICIGLKGGDIKGEYEIIKYLSENPPNKLTFIVLIPTKGTEYENVNPPKLNEVADVICEARISMPSTIINLGCMRPRGNYRNELDKIALDCGINKIVLPAKSVRNKANQMNLDIIETRECCVL